MNIRFTPSLLTLGMLAAFSPLSSAQSAAEPQENKETSLEVIEVTAQKRVQSINDTAIAITAISGNDIINQGSTSYDEAIEGVPGVKVQGIAQGAQVFIRGVGSQVDPAFADPAVATLIDGVYTGRTESVQSGTYDISRIEVLRGPQGTLYGRNASGGSMNVITRDPELGDIEGYVTAQAGNFNLRRLEGAVNLPIGDEFAFRAAAFNSDRDGYISDGSMEDNSWGARVKMLYQPSDELRALLKYEISEFEGNAANTVPVQGWQGNLTFPPFLGAFAPDGWAVNDDSNPWENDKYHPPGFMKRKSETLSLDLSTDLDWASISLLTAYSDHENLERSSHLFGITDPDVFFGCGTSECYLEGTGNATYKTTELRFNSPVDAPFVWMVGLYYLSSQGDIGGDGQELDLSDGTYLYNQAFAPSKTKAIFGQATYPVSDQLRLTAGLRLSNDTRETAYELFSPAGDLVDTQAQSTEDDSVTWKLGIEFDLSKDQLLYAHAASGFKQGGVNTTIPITVFAAEELISYEIGSKNTLLNNNMQLNAAVFYYDYKNYHVPSLQSIPVADTGEVSVFPYTLNAGDSTIYGAEVTLEWLVSDSGKITSSATTLQTEYGETELPVNPFVAGGPYQLEGREMVNAPSFTAMFGYEHNWEFKEGILFASVTTNYSSDYFTSLEYYLPGAHQDSFTRTDASIRYESFDDWSLGLWVRNIEDEAQTTYVFPAYRRFITAPRTVGVNVNYRF
ncbi:TonB-dependent receptor [Aestuariibacter sp. GS-14]|uniref:TonB-dependent receptor n=1 Tax=Aestuariibacter sp. GS-14 TaxID=2590670 RepID=UPI00112AA137|nr:TonB-dependent receptor [Aestuariibacter sp. GS-14]TPV60880.1 TonB-dependent receptor [Aestuariibacter sp. GS-14]